MMLYEEKEAITDIIEGYNLRWIQSKYPLNPETSRYEKEYVICLNTKYSIERYSDMEEVEQFILTDLKYVLFQKFNIDEYIEDFSQYKDYQKTHTDKTVANGMSIYCDEWNKYWEVIFYVNKPVKIPNHLICKPLGGILT